MIHSKRPQAPSEQKRAQWLVFVQLLLAWCRPINSNAFTLYLPHILLLLFFVSSLPSVWVNLHFAFCCSCKSVSHELTHIQIVRFKNETIDFPRLCFLIDMLWSQVRRPLAKSQNKIPDNLKSRSAHCE